MGVPLYREPSGSFFMANLTEGRNGQELDIATPYGTTHCITAGDKSLPPLLLFHGVGDNSAVMWLLNMKELARHFYCIAVETLGDYRLDRKKDFTGVLDAGNFRYKVIQGSGHGVNHEQPERVHGEMIDFLKKAPV